MFKCPLCGSEYETERELQEHLGRNPECSCYAYQIRMIVELQQAMQIRNDHLRMTLLGMRNRRVGK